jgi:GT2 family glycosyltransferase
MNKKIGVVIVSYNRLNKLKIAINSFEKQTVLPVYIIIVNNHSLDGTEAFLKEWEKENSGYQKKVINTESNLGGSGGFYLGLSTSLKLSADWIWVSDDDAFPKPDALEKASSFLDSNEDNLDNISAICGEVINNGEIDLDHRRTIFVRHCKILSVPSSKDQYLNPFFEINSFSYVGTIINKYKIMQVGLPNKDFFIYYDDSEHSLRLSKVGKILCVPKIVVFHDQPLDLKKRSSGISWKTYYGMRNSLVMYREFFPKFIVDMYFQKQMLKLFFEKIFSPKKAKENAIIKQGLLDGRSKKLGIHPIYKPGWKLKQ